MKPDNIPASLTVGIEPTIKPRYAIMVLMALVLSSCVAGLCSYKSTSRLVAQDMDNALSLTIALQQSQVITPDTIRIFNSCLHINELKGRVTLAVDAKQQSRFRVYAQCPKATILGLSDQRPAMLLWSLTVLWCMLCWRWSRRAVVSSQPMAAVPAGTRFGGLAMTDDGNRFFDANGDEVRFTPMQRQLMMMFFRSKDHIVAKDDICDALWPKKMDASDTLYTLIRRLRPIVQQHAGLEIQSERGRAYRLIARR